ncbi:NAD-dependent epimerase/dehydratase family protein [Winogradskyella poriferorum]|uniref:NAD-dependent epimerase/dehydratase family protein n=1 Tax=Winogradskyella poriferorum TaxID=307627 RepID=UPI003D64F027
MSHFKSRRSFIKTSAMASLALPILGTSILSCKSEKKDLNSTSKKLKILILGGTSFLGPHQIAYALSRGHSISTFTRGKTIPKIHAELFKDVEQLIGDRENNLKALENRKWDVVIDNSGRKVEWTKATAILLKDNVGLYMYTSSTGVYYPYLTGNLSTDTKLVLEMPEGLTEDEKYEQDYGIMKANSELEAIKAFGEDRTTIIRPTYMLGPGDRMDRFMHWPVRLAEGGEIMVPGKKDDSIQYVDVRDIAEWFIRLAETKTAGIYNGVGPANPQTMQQFINEASKSFDKEHHFVYIDDYDFLKDNEFYFSIPWIIPLDKHYGSARVTNAKSKKNGLTFRPLNDTLKSILKWWDSEAVSNERRDKFNSNLKQMVEKEKGMITAWNSR